MTPRVAGRTIAEKRYLINQGRPRLLSSMTTKAGSHAVDISAAGSNRGQSKSKALGMT